MESKEILPVIAGAAIGFITTLISAYLAEERRRRAKAKAYKTYLRLELGDAIKSLDSIRARYEDQGYYRYQLIDALDRSNTRLQDSRKEVYHLSDSKIEEDIFVVMNRLTLLAADMRGVQDYSTTDEHADGTKLGKAGEDARDELVKTKRSAHMVELLDLKREVTTLTERL